MNAAGPARSAVGRAVLAAVAGAGLSAVVTQLCLLRELLGAFCGSELLLGLCLGNWLAATGAGALLGGLAARRGGRIGLFAGAQIAIAVLPPLQVAAVRVLRDVVFVRGAAAGPAGAWLGSLVVLAPYCLAAGALLALACAIAGEREGGTTGEVYLADAAGSVLGGLLFVFVISSRQDHLGAVCGPALLNLVLAVFVARSARRPLIAAAACAVAGGLAAGAILVNGDALTTALQHRGETVVLRANSPYGRLVACRDSGLVTFYENGFPVASSEDIGRAEEAVHYGMCQRPGARAVLLIGGGIAGDALEILRYPRVGRVAYAELDPAIVAAGRSLVPRSLADPRIAVQLDDGRRLVRRSHGAFDVIIVDLPDPSTALLNRYYTVEFFREASAALRPGGVLAFGLGRYENFAGPELARLLSSGRRTVLEAFSSVLMLPGGRVFFVASDGPLDPDVARLIDASGVRPRLVNRHYLGATLTADRIADVGRAASLPAGVNTDANPVLYYYEMRRWMSQFGGGDWLLPAAVVAAILACGAAQGPVRRAVFGAGFAASALEMVLLMGYQALYGSVYRQVGLLVTVFMGGLAAGAWLQGRFRGGAAPRRGVALLSLAIAALAAAVPGVLRAAGSLGVPGETVGQAAILAAGFALAALVGFQFALAGRTGGDGGGAAGLFGADLAGASLGALIGGPLLVPVAGVSGACLAIALLNAVAAALALGKRPCTS